VNYFIDTNVFLRVLIAEDDLMFGHGVALLTATKQGTVSAHTSCLVLSEISWTLSSFYHFGKPDVVRALRGIADLANLRITDNADAGLALTLYERCNVKWIDCLIASSPDVQSNATTIVSYDRDFDKLGVARIGPGQIPTA